MTKAKVWTFEGVVKRLARANGLWLSELERASRVDDGLLRSLFAEEVARTCAQKPIARVAKALSVHDSLLFWFYRPPVAKKRDEEVLLMINETMKRQVDMFVSLLCRG